MKYIKSFENNNKPQVGDYAVINPYSTDKDISKWVKNNIGKIIKITDDIGGRVYTMYYDNIPKYFHELHFSYGIEKNIIKTKKFGILKHSKNKKNLNIYINTQKYNL